jgi:CheY-like chemotaxis protein
MSKTTVLIIDDNQDFQILVKFVLEQDTSWKVLTALTGEEGIALAQSYHPDVILLDIAMPELDGFDVYRSLKFHSSTRSIPIIFMTAIIGMEKEIEQRTAKDIKIITKPFNVLTLESQIIDTFNTQSDGFNTLLSN